jgi:hypothetical protein
VPCEHCAVKRAVPVDAAATKRAVSGAGSACSMCEFNADRVDLEPCELPYALYDLGDRSFERDAHAPVDRNAALPPNVDGARAHIEAPNERVGQQRAVPHESFEAFADRRRGADDEAEELEILERKPLCDLNRAAASSTAPSCSHSVNMRRAGTRNRSSVGIASRSEGSTPRLSPKSNTRRALLAAIVGDQTDVAIGMWGRLA